jgi:hypothetical protein
MVQSRKAELARRPPTVGAFGRHIQGQILTSNLDIHILSFIPPLFELSRGARTHCSEKGRRAEEGHSIYSIVAIRTKVLEAGGDSIVSYAKFCRA